MHIMRGGAFDVAHNVTIKNIQNMKFTLNLLSICLDNGQQLKGESRAARPPIPAHLHWMKLYIYYTFTNQCHVNNTPLIYMNGKHYDLTLQLCLH